MRAAAALNGGIAPAGELALEVDCAHVELAGELGEHLAHDALDVAFLVAEVVVERLQRRVGDLQLRGGELEVEGRLLGGGGGGGRAGWSGPMRLASSAMGQRYSGAERRRAILRS